jgi:hypothetical protein
VAHGCQRGCTRRPKTYFWENHRGREKYAFINSVPLTSALCLLLRNLGQPSKDLERAKRSCWEFAFGE